MPLQVASRNSMDTLGAPSVYTVLNWPTLGRNTAPQRLCPLRTKFFRRRQSLRVVLAPGGRILHVRMEKM